MENKFYIAEFPRETEFAEAYPTGGATYDYDRFDSCPLCGERVSGCYWVPPREVVLTKRKVPDFLYTYCDNAPFVISPKALHVIQEAGLTGIKCAEEIEHVRFQRKSKKEDVIPRFYHIELERSRVTVNHEKSIIHYGKSRRTHTCALCRQVPAMFDFTRRMVFNVDAYEGYDIFHIYELGSVAIVSQRFVDVCRENGLTNLHVTPAEIYGQWAAAYFLDGDEDA